MVEFTQALYGLFVPEDEFAGQGLVEYALIIAFIAILVIAAMIFLKDRINGLFSKVGSSLGT